MNYLPDEWNMIKRKVGRKKLFLFFDYDGTLASITEKPDMAFIPKQIRAILARAAGNHAFKIAVISGRSLDDIKKRIGIRGIIYSGNHGLEIEGPSVKFKVAIPVSFRRLLESLRNQLLDDLSGFAGVFVENKRLSLTIHYRQAARKMVPFIRKAIKKAVIHSVKAGKIKTRNGKMIVEILPPIQWNKGFAVKWILDHPFFSARNDYPIYFGDDITDEDAFLALQGRGIAVMVGRRRKTHAPYYLHDVADVGRFIDQL